MNDNIEFNLAFYITRYKHEDYQTYVEYNDRIKDFDELESRTFEAIENITGFDKGEQLPGLRRQNEELTRSELIVNGESGILLWNLGGDVSQKDYYTDNISDGWKNSNEQSLFAQGELNLSSELSLLGGLRYEHSEIYGSDLSPKIAIKRKDTAVFKDDDSLVLRASVAKGYRAPDFKELYYELPHSTKSMSIIGGELLRKYAPWEPRLKPEISLGINAGPEYFWKEQLHIHANFFWNELWDALSFTSFDKDSKTYQRLVEIFPRGIYSGEVTDYSVSEYTKAVTNVDRVRTFGAETYFAVELNSWESTVSYVHVYAKDITNDQRLENKPT